MERGRSTGIADGVDDEGGQGATLEAPGRDLRVRADHLVPDPKRGEQPPGEVRAPEERAARLLGERRDDRIVYTAAAVPHSPQPAELAELREAARAPYEEQRIVPRHDPAYAPVPQDRCELRLVV